MGKPPILFFIIIAHLIEKEKGFSKITDKFLANIAPAVIIL